MTSEEEYTLASYAASPVRPLIGFDESLRLHRNTGHGRTVRSHGSPLLVLTFYLLQNGLALG
jgi:hypothetical protein